MERKIKSKKTTTDRIKVMGFIWNRKVEVVEYESAVSPLIEQEERSLEHE